MLGGQKKRKDRKIWKSRGEEKVSSFSSASLFPAKKQEAADQGETRGIDHLMQRRTQGAGTIKDRGQVRLRVHSRYLYIKQE